MLKVGLHGNTMLTVHLCLSPLLFSAVSLPELAMRPDEEPEQQLAAVTPAQLAEHAAALKAAADKAAGMGALGGFAAAAGGSKPAAFTAAGAAAVKPSAQSKQQQHQQQGGGASGVARELSQPELHRLQVERDALTSECGCGRELGGRGGHGRKGCMRPRVKVSWAIVEKLERCCHGRV